MKIKKAVSEKHLDCILNIQQRCYPPEMIESACVFRSIIDAGESFVFVHDDSIVGYALCHSWHHIDRPPKLHEELDTIKQHACLFIHDLAIDPGYQKQGFASTFVKFLCNTTDLPITLVSVNNTCAFWSQYNFVPVHCDADILHSFSGKAVYMILL